MFDHHHPTHSHHSSSHARFVMCPLCLILGKVAFSAAGQYSNPFLKHNGAFAVSIPGQRAKACAPASHPDVQGLQKFAKL